MQHEVFMLRRWAFKSRFAHKIKRKIKPNGVTRGCEVVVMEKDKN